MAEILPEGEYPLMTTSVAVTPEASAQYLIRDYCKWHVAPEHTESIIVNGSGTNHLFLPTLKIKELLGVSVDGVALDVESVQWDEGGILYHPFGIWPKGPRRVMVSLTHGYPPERLMWLVNQIANRVSGGAPAGVERVTVGQRSVTYRDESGKNVLMADEKQALLPYRLDRKIR